MRRALALLIPFLVGLCASMLLLHFGRADAHVPRSGIPTAIHVAECPADAHYLGCAYFDDDRRTADIFISPRTRGRMHRFTYWHEVGHVYSHFRLTEAARASWLRWLHPYTTTWAPEIEETFADGYADCALHWRPARWEGRDAMREYRRRCRLLFRIDSSFGP